MLFELLTNPVIIALNSGIAFCLGLLIGNRLAIGRDKRKEYNAVAQPIRAALLKSHWGSDPFDVVTVDLLYQHLSFCQRRGFRRAIERYEQCKKDGVLEYDTTYGTQKYKDISHLEARIDELLSYVKLR